MKIVLNKCFGGFGLSPLAIAECRNRGLDAESDFRRDHPILIEVVELLGEKANGPYAKLVVVDIPNGPWEIDEYDGRENAVRPIEVLG